MPDEINKVYAIRRRNQSGPERNALFVLPRKAIPIAQFYIASHRVKPKSYHFSLEQPSYLLSTSASLPIFCNYK
jgi:hypothetical protein